MGQMHELGMDVAVDSVFCDRVINPDELQNLSVRWTAASRVSKAGQPQVIPYQTCVRSISRCSLWRRRLSDDIYCDTRCG